MSSGNSKQEYGLFADLLAPAVTGISEADFGDGLLQT